MPELTRESTRESEPAVEDAASPNPTGPSDAQAEPGGGPEPGHDSGQDAVHRASAPGHPPLARGLRHDPVDRLREVCVTGETPMADAMRQMDAAGLGIVLVVDDDRRLLGTITDGDIRRAILNKQDLGVRSRAFVEAKRNPIYPRPVSAPAGSDAVALLKLMHDKTLHQLPLLDADERVVDLIVMDDLLTAGSGGGASNEPGSPDAPQMAEGIKPPTMQALIMAGGFGKRLMPLTENTPKPMLPVGGRPLLERTLDRLKNAGIHHVSLSTHYMPEKVVDHFQNGEAFGVNLQYVQEDRPLGTAGALGLLNVPNEPVLVINGDILTNVDFRAMHQFHRDHGSVLTVGLRKYEISVPYGVVECDGVHVQHLKEKPVYESFVNAGVYLLDPQAFGYIPREIAEGERFNMTDLIEVLIANDRPVVGFPIHEYWLDIGQPDDYERAESDVANGRYSD